jgi:hypothetical protein
MNIHVNAPSFFRSSLRIGSAILVVVGACLVIPKIADAALTLKHPVSRYSIPDTKNNLSETQANSQDLSNGYEPPNFGYPSSAYGSGTR